jgi:hypothetical protein
MFKIFNDINPESNILLAGCGGGYDCFTALPLYFSLKQKYMNVSIANLSFTDQKYLDNFPQISEGCFNISYTQNVDSQIYFPEYELARELNTNVYAFIDNGMKKYEKSYIELIKKLGVDIIILCDGGCDSIMTGKEEKLATPVEDVMSMLIVNKLLDMKLISNAYLLLLGSTVDTFGEINRKDFIENIELLTKSNMLLEQVLLTTDKSDKNAEYVIKYKRVFERSQPYNSIVNASICARLDKLNGNILPPLLIKDGIPRCDTQYFEIDDYLTTYYLFNLSDIINRICYTDMIKDCDDSDEIDNIIMDFNNKLWPNIL